jgi:TPR repeat protein
MRKSVLARCTNTGRVSNRTTAWLRSGTEKPRNTFPIWGGAGQGRNDLGILYEQGLGVPKDFVQAYVWISLANGDVSYAKDNMTPAQVLDAERMASEWKGRHLMP